MTLYEEYIALITIYVIGLVFYLWYNHKYKPYDFNQRWRIFNSIVWPLWFCGWMLIFLAFCFIYYPFVWFINEFFKFMDKGKS